MRKLFQILKRRNQEAGQDYNIDKILSENKLNYYDINFESDNIDILKSFNSLNQKLNNKSLQLKSSKHFIPHLNYNLILKPIYTIALTSIIIFAVIKFKSYVTPVEYAEISVEKGEKITVHITENIIAYLNSESTIKIPLEPKRNSKILLDGEAYFEISKNKKTSILANGITFNCSNANFSINTNTENNLVAYVSKGDLNIYNPQMPIEAQINLSKGEKATYNIKPNFIAIERAKNSNYLAWHTGTLEFKNEPLLSIVNIISDYYKIPIKIENKDLENLTYSAKFQNSEIDEILDIIQFKFNCNITTDGSKIVIN